MKKNLNIYCENIYCTKIASKLTRTYTDKHGLKELCKELLNIDISKQQQSSDWGNTNLSDSQLKYAASDVLYLHDIKLKLDIKYSKKKFIDKLDGGISKFEINKNLIAIRKKKNFKIKKIINDCYEIKTFV